MDEYRAVCLVHKVKKNTSAFWFPKEDYAKKRPLYLYTYTYSYTYTYTYTYTYNYNYTYTYNLIFQKHSLKKSEIVAFRTQDYQEMDMVWKPYGAKQEFN